MADYLIAKISDNKFKEFKTACAYFQTSMKRAFINEMDRMVSAHRVSAARNKSKQSTSKNEEVN